MFANVVSQIENLHNIHEKRRQEVLATKRIIEGLTGGVIHLSEGFICKLQQRAYDALAPFEREVRMPCHVLQPDFLTPSRS